MDFYNTLLAKSLINEGGSGGDGSSDVLYVHYECTTEDLMTFTNKKWNVSASEVLQHMSKEKPVYICITVHYMGMALNCLAQSFQLTADSSSTHCTSYYIPYLYTGSSYQAYHVSVDKYENSGGTDELVITVSIL